VVARQPRQRHIDSLEELRDATAREHSVRRRRNLRHHDSCFVDVPAKVRTHPMQSLAKRDRSVVLRLRAHAGKHRPIAEYRRTEGPLRVGLAPEDPRGSTLVPVPPALLRVQVRKKLLRGVTWVVFL